MTRLNPFSLSLSIIVDHPVKYALGSPAFSPAVHREETATVVVVVVVRPRYKNLVSLFNTRTVLIVDKIL